jgi:hypothetical protein
MSLSSDDDPQGSRKDSEHQSSSDFEELKDNFSKKRMNPFEELQSASQKRPKAELKDTLKQNSENQATNNQL